MRILLADGHCMFREGLRMILEREPDMTVVAEVENGASAVERTIELLPDVVVLDISMPKLNGFEAARMIHERVPQVEVVVVSMHCDRHHVVEAFKSGVKSYILKNCASHELVFALRAAYNRESYLSPSLSDVIISCLVGSAESSYSKDLLTLREHQAFLLLACGKSCKEIAFELKISHKTVETYRQKVMKKLNVLNMVQLANYAMREGIVIQS